jgi:hypothetical protein
MSNYWAFRHAGFSDHETTILKELAKIGAVGKIFVVDGANGSDSHNGQTFETPFATMTKALAMCTAGDNDVVLVVPSATAITETAAVDWNKAFTHIIGLGPEGRHGKRTRIISGTDDLSPFFTFSATGCVVKNIRIVHEQASDTGSLICAKVTGTRCNFENVEFAGPATVESAIDGSCALYLQGASECTFKDCTIGLNTVLQATGCSAITIHASGDMARTRFENCIIQGYAGATTTYFVEILGTTGIDRELVFKECEFYNLGTSTMATAFLCTGADPNSKRVVLIRCTKLGVTDWDHANSGLVFTDIAAQTTTNAAGTLTVTSS